MGGVTEADSLTEQIKRGDWLQISQYLSKLADEDYEDISYFARGLLLLYGPIEQRNLNMSLTLIEKACLLSPTKVNFQNTYSEVLLQAKQPQKAFDVAKLCQERFPNNALSAIALGRAAWECKNRAVAYCSYQQASLLVPQGLTDVRSQIDQMLFKLAPLWWDSLQGKRLLLVRKGQQHREFLIECRQDKGFHHHYNLFQEPTPEAVDRELLAADSPPLESKKIEWVVEKDGLPIGVAALVDLNLNNSRAELLIGFPGAVSSLSTVEATLLVLEFAFSRLGLFKIYSYVYSDNPKGQKNTLSLGFEQEGILKSHVQDPYVKQRLDLYVNGCLQKDFFANLTLMKMARRLLGRVPQVKTSDETVSAFG